jgi:predicted metal-binding membrane protein
MSEAGRSTIGQHVTGTQVGRAQRDTVAGLADSPRLIVVAAAIGGAWLIAVLAQLTGNAGALHHHALIEGGPPLWVAVPLFLVAWQVMIAAMMLPASLPALRVFAALSVRLSRPGLAMVAFLGAYAVVWTAVGLAAFMGDVALHRLVDATPFLGARPWLVEAGVLTLAGTYQFVPLKRRGLAACRHPAGQVGAGTGTEVRAARRGFQHAIDCVACSWALMLLMFAAGFANLWWMAALAVLMAYETIGRHGQRAAVAAGGVLLGLAGLVVLTGWAPAFGAA